MQRRSVAIAVIAAAIVIFAGGVGLLRVERPGERMAARAPLVPRPPADETSTVESGLARIQGNAGPTVAETEAPPASSTPSTATPAATTSAPAAHETPTAVSAAVPNTSRHAALVETPSAVTDAPRATSSVEKPLPKRKEPLPTAATPSFDIVRVEPNGDTLVAGRAAPDSTVALVDRDRTVAEARTDAAGNFVLTPPALPSGDHALALREGQGARIVESTQSVVVSVPHTRSQQVVVALAEPNQPTRLLSEPAAAPTAPATSAAGSSSVPPTAAPDLAIRSVELENGSGLFASGVAPPGTDVRLYLNNSRVADVIAAAAGAWTVTVRRGLTAGRYAVRADSLKPDQSVAARVEVPFDVPPAALEREKPTLAEKGVAVAVMPRERPDAQAALSAPATTKVASSQVAATQTAVEPRSRNAQVAAAANAVVEELQTELVTRGDNLWRISRKRLGFGTRYTQIYAANAAQIRDPRLIYPGQVFVMPR